MWCSHCQENVQTTRPFDGSLACAQCGKVLEDYNFSLDPTFEKDASGQGRLTGRYVKSIESDYSASRERTLQKAEDGISNLCYGLGIDQAHGLVTSALRLYKIALGKNFTRGRRSEHVEAACLYIACREKKAPYLLIDFSNLLTVNVYVLGAVFLQLCKALSLEEHPIVQKPLDPSIFIHKYTNHLSGGRNNDVEKSALRIIARMNRDWMQTGRKPSGLWGAAVYISAIAHGIKCSKTDILRLVHICEATLTKRLVEFEDTESGSLTIEELNAKATHEKENITVDKSDPRELLCEHKGTSTPHFAIGLCHSCYNEFVEISGGLEGGLDPPAFQRAERERAKRENLEKSSSKEISDDSITPEELGHSQQMDGTKANDVDHSKSNNGNFSEINDTNTQHVDESDTLSDIDDVEVEGYLHNEEEKHYKKIIWEEMNREYLEEQAAKEAAAAAAREASAANFKNDSADFQAKQELAAAAAASVAKLKKERQQRRAAEARNLAPAETAGEALGQMLTKKKLSSKINYEVFNKLFDGPVDSGNPHKKQKESHFNNDDKVSHKSRKELESKEMDKDADTALDDDNEDIGDDDNDLYNHNVDEMYDYDDDCGYDDFE